MKSKINPQLKLITRTALMKLVTDFYSIAAFLYTPIDILVKSCRSIRKQLLGNHYHDDLYQSAQFGCLLKKTVYGRDALFKDNVLNITALTSTFALQLISFFTTWAGVSYYFSSISPYAPFAFAFTIQFLFYMLSNFGRGRNQFVIQKKLMLASVFFISMLFSYIGIINHYVPPIKTFEQKYTSFYHSYDSLYRQMIQTFKQNLAPPDNQIDQLFNNARELQVLAATETAKYDSKLEGMSGIKETIRTGRNQWGYTTYEANPAYESAQKERLEYEDSRSHLISSIQNLNQYLTQAESDPSLKSSLNDYLKDSRITPQLTSSNSTFTLFTSAYNQLLSLLPAGIMDMAEQDLFQLADQYISNTQSLTLELNSFQSLRETTENPAGIISNDYLYQLSDAIENEINSKYEKLLISAHNALPDMDQTELNLKYQDLIPLPDINLLALEKLLPSSEYWKQGMVAFFLALLVDGMTVLIPLLTQSHHHSSLNISTKKRLPYSEEDILEKILLSISCSLPPDTRITSCSTAGSQAAASYSGVLPICQPASQYTADPSQLRFIKCITILSDYFSLFSSSPWTNIHGYSKRLEESRLQAQNSAIFSHLTDILCSLSYLTVISQQEYRLLVNESKNTISPHDSEDPEESKETIYLMKKGFDLWISENLSQLLMLGSHLS